MTIAIALIRELATRTSVPRDLIALTDATGTVVGVNNNWLALSEQTGTEWNRVEPGVNYLELCRRASHSSAEAREALNGIRAVVKGKVPSFTMDYMCGPTAEPRYFRMVVMPIHYSGARFVISHTDITELQLSKEETLKRSRRVSRRLIKAHEEERERIARDMHDDIGTKLALLSFSIDRIMKQRWRRAYIRTNEFNQVMENIRSLSNSVRNLSHGLHCPLLNRAGIAAALRTLCEEFERTQDIEIEIAIPAELPSVPDEVGLCIFRVSQECLHNIAKHAHARRIRVVLERSARDVRLTISDNGRGFVPSEELQRGGLGLIGMKERILCVRGALEIKSAPGAGTEIHVTIPISAKKVAE